MKYVLTMLLVALTLAGIAFASVVFLAPAPIRAEYWVREMLTVKHEILTAYAGKRKIVVLSGSNSLFNVDTGTLTDQLGEPVINLGLHQFLALDEILAEGASSVSAGDVVVLPLEPHFYCEGGMTSWQIRNDIAWDERRWSTLSLRDRFGIALKAGPVLPFEIIVARLEKRFLARLVAARLQALDDESVLARHARATVPTGFAYSANNIDRLGNMRGTDSTSPYRGRYESASTPTPVCPSSVAKLRAFVGRMHASGVRVYLANVPYVLVDGLDPAAVAAADTKFVADVSVIAPVLDSRASLLFDRRYFLNSDLHLNAAGRALRTTLLADSLRRAGASN
jgi:hypothetical protein